MQEIKKRYPNIAPEEAAALPWEELNKMSIGLMERLIKEYKDMLQNVFRNSKEFQCSEEDLEWYKTYLRDEKNSLETRHKIVVQHQRDIREGLC